MQIHPNISSKAGRHYCRDRDRERFVILAPVSLAPNEFMKVSLLGLIALGTGLACSSTDDPAVAGNAGTSVSVAGSTSGGGGMSPSSAGNAGTVSTAGNAGSAATIGGTSAGGGGGSSSGAGGVAGGMGGASGSNGGGSGGVGGSGAGGGGRGGSGGSGGSGGGSGSFDPCPAAEDCKVLPLGDSITFGTPTNNGGYRVKLFIDAKTDNKKMTIVGGASGGAMPNGPQNVMVGGMSVPFPRGNEGYPGITIGDLDSQHVSNGKAFANMPHIVLMHIGTNDMYGGNPGGAPDALKKIIDDISMKVPNALIAVASIIPLASGNAQVMTYNATIPGIVQMKAAAGKHVIYVDQYKDFPTSELTDGVHPNDTNGYPRMGDVWYAAIKQYLH